MSYQNALHGSAASSAYSPIAGAVCTSPAGAKFTSPYRRRVPQAIWTPTTNWRGGPTRVFSPILFDLSGHQYQGVSMRELSTRGQQGLDQVMAAPGDHVLRNTGLNKITLRILWTGYEHLEWARPIDIDASVTRSQLSILIASQVARFMERCRAEPGNNPHWSIGSSGIRYEHAVLVGLFHVHADVWQADLAVDFR